jgi:hypothetical protein
MMRRGAEDVVVAMGVVVFRVLTELGGLGVKVGVPEDSTFTSDRRVSMMLISLPAPLLLSVLLAPSPFLELLFTAVTPSVEI